MRPWVKPECRCQSGVPIDDQVDELLCREFQDKSVGEDSFKVLGIHWLANQDCFSFDGVKMPRYLCVTKRLVLSLISRLSWDLLPSSSW